jgi:cytoskeletal protein RodZ
MVRDNRIMFEIGASLREARVKRGLSPADVQKAIRIRDRYLQALEEERWELLPGDAYVKGFLRTYADFLGLEANLYVDEYNSRSPHHDELSHSPQPLRRAEPVSHRLADVRPLLLVIALLAVGGGVAAWQLTRSPQQGQPAPPTTVTTTGHSKTHKKKSHSPPPALPTRAVLVASRGACWLEVRSGGATGQLVYERTLQQGQKLPVQLGRGPVWISIGAPWNLDVRLGGKLVHGLPSQTGNVILSRHGLRPA